MSKYTIDVKTICSYYAGMDEIEFDDIEEVISKSWDKIFKGFPIFDETYREKLCSKILEHYFMREICAETVGLWRMWLNSKMNEIMPYYNELYKTTLLEYDPLTNTRLTRDKDETLDGETRGNSTDVNDGASNVTNNGSGDRMFSDTPQGALNNVREGRYLTDATVTTTTDTSNGTTHASNTKEYKDETDNVTTTNETIAGKVGSVSYATLIREHRDNLVNIDMMIIEELEELFLGIW